MAYIILIALGVLVGALAGIVGLGGGFVVVPLLRYCYGYTQTMAQGTSLAMLLPPIGVLAAWQYWRAGQMNIGVAMLLAAGFLVGGYIGGAFAVKLPALTLQRIFGAFFLLVSLRMLLAK